ncbi:hypothetical protein [Bdellovibrio sp. HCB-162]|uniref:hypothetical protein n=1 Tax=Bdellovibrio sp. HCB-162 TaxID=3394234 RepID=UPI0039BCB602
MFLAGCYQEVITLGSYVRAFHRDKFYQLTAEVIEVALPEGVLTEYVMESYERSYLSILIALSYFNLDKKEEALVELRQSMMDENAHIYNHGNDPVITLLHAAIWSNFDLNVARPFWKKLSEDKNVSSEVQSFSQERVQEIDGNKKFEGTWRIFGLGYMPRLTWKTDFIKRENGPYKIMPTRNFPKTCSTNSTILMPTSSWVQKLSKRYEADYHPLLYTKSVVRVPFGFTYGVLGVTTGVAAGATGCAIGAYANSSSLCADSLNAAGYIIKKTGNMVEYVMAPDLRHWEKMPTAFFITRGNIDQSVPCLFDVELNLMTLHTLAR